MLDHRVFLEDSEAILEGLKRRGVDAEALSALTSAAQQRREAVSHLDNLRHELNAASGQVQAFARSGEQDKVDAARQALKSLKERIKQAEHDEAAIEETLQQHLHAIPNLPHESAPVGRDESENRVERTVGEPTDLGFTPAAHDALGEALGILDFQRAAKISGSRFVVLRGDGARLERALLSYMLDEARRNGYEEILPPLLVRPEAMVTAGQYPKFIGESFETLDSEYALIPTSEVPLVNLHRDEILDEDTLPRRYCAFTPCFRREAGAAGRDTRGLIRLHQFNKVELVSYCTPDDSFAELERITQNAESILQALKLPYRVVSLCTGDMSFTSAKTYDIEVWLPSQDCYREISSCSNCTDYQARRGKMRYRPVADGPKRPKPRLLHTLNGSGLAVGRTLVAILENYQDAEGNVRIPDVLQPYMGGQDILRKPAED